MFSVEVLCEESRRQEKDERAQSQRTREERAESFLSHSQRCGQLSRDVEVIGDVFEA